eukprot:EG_transcript_5488
MDHTPGLVRRAGATSPTEHDHLLGGHRRADHGSLLDRVLPPTEEWRPDSPLPRTPIIAPKGRSAAFATMVMVNAIVGSGVLSLPYAFVKGGLLLSSVFLMIVSFCAYITASWLVEAQSRAQALCQLTIKAKKQAKDLEHGKAGNKLDLPDGHPYQRKPSVDIVREEILHETVALLESPQGKSGTLPEPFPLDFQIGDSRVFEMNELCGLFLGRAGQRMFEAAFFLYTYSTMWLYASIVANSLLSVIPVPFLTHYLECNAYSLHLSVSCITAYRIWLVVLCVFLLPICFVEVHALARIQVALNVLGYGCVTTMVVSVAIALYTSPAYGAHAPASPPFVAPNTLVDPSGFGIAFATTIFTQMCHWGIPSFTQTLRDKAQINQVMRNAFSTTFSIYLVLSLLCALYFGETIMPTITLNFRRFTLLPDGSRPAWMEVISTTVVIVPVFTIMCAIPIFVHTLGNNLVMALSPDAWKRLLNLPEQHQQWPPQSLAVACRLVALVPPFALAFLERDASTIVALCGLLGFVMMFFIPVLLQWFSIAKLEGLWPRHERVWWTPFSSWASPKPVVLSLAAFAAVGFVFNARTVFEKVAAKL